MSVSWPFSQEVQWGVGGQPSCAFPHPSCLPSPDFSRDDYKMNHAYSQHIIFNIYFYYLLYDKELGIEGPHMLDKSEISLHLNPGLVRIKRSKFFKCLSKFA
jgi:hypothetical protein